MAFLYRFLRMTTHGSVFDCRSRTWHSEDQRRAIGRGRQTTETTIAHQQGAGTAVNDSEICRRQDVRSPVQDQPAGADESSYRATETLSGSDQRIGGRSIKEDKIHLGTDALQRDKRQPTSCWTAREGQGRSYEIETDRRREAGFARCPALGTVLDGTDAQLQLCNLDDKQSIANPNTEGDQSKERLVKQKPSVVRSGVGTGVPESQPAASRFRCDTSLRLGHVANRSTSAGRSDSSTLTTTSVSRTAQYTTTTATNPADGSRRSVIC